MLHMHSLSLNSDRPDQIDSAAVTVTYLSFFAVRITWEPPCDNFNNITFYHISYTLEPPNTTVITIDTPEVVLANLGINKNYSLTVSAENGVGSSDESGTVQFTSLTSSEYFVDFIIYIPVPYIRCFQLTKVLTLNFNYFANFAAHVT